MSLQKYRFDRTHDAMPNGSRPVYSEWLGGPSLAGIRNCPIDVVGAEPRTVYVTGEPDTFFSVPAVCRLFGFAVRGFLYSEDEGYRFRVTRVDNAR